MMYVLEQLASDYWKVTVAEDITGYGITPTEAIADLDRRRNV